MLKKFKEIAAVINIKPTQELQTFRPTIRQEDPREAAKINRLIKHFEENREYILIRSLRPHDINCSDPYSCEDMNCYKWQPDRIAGKQYKVDRRTRKKVD